jgi:hypothetical protein
MSFMSTQPLPITFESKRRMTGKSSSLLAVIALPMVVACSSPQEPVTVQLAVVADASAVDSVTTDLGYQVELSEARMVIDGLQFTIAGEAHATSLWKRVSDFIIPNANAHPGHYQGGEVTGELRGRYVVDWLPGEDTKLGSATLIVGGYHSANFTFETASKKDDDLDSNDDLIGHTALLRGTATRAGTNEDAPISFVASIDSPAGRQLVGAPFDYEITEATNVRLGLALATKDPLEGDTLFDGLDFAALDPDGDGRVVIEAGSGDGAALDAYNNLRRTFQTHDHFAIEASKK